MNFIQLLLVCQEILHAFKLNYSLIHLFFLMKPSIVHSLVSSKFDRPGDTILVSLKGEIVGLMQNTAFFIALRTFLKALYSVVSHKEFRHEKKAAESKYSALSRAQGGISGS